MRRSRTRFAAAAAAAGAAMLALGLVIPSAAKTAPSLDVYDLNASGSGVEAKLAVKPSAFDPLVHFATPFVRSTLSSLGGGLSRSLAGTVFPGDLAFGYAGEASVADHFRNGSDGQFDPSFLGGTATSSLGHSTVASHPDRPSRDVSAVEFPRDDAQRAASGDALDFRAGRVQATAKRAANGATTTYQSVRVRAPGDDRTLVSVGTIEAAAQGTASAASVAQTVSFTLHDVAILDGTIRIGTVVSRASASSDGRAGTAGALLTFGDVRVMAGGAYRAARIDEKGIHIDDPALGRDLNNVLDLSLQHSLNQSDLRIFSGGTTRVEESTGAEATSGGLVVAFSTGRPPWIPLPPLPVAIPQNPEVCLPGAPLCVEPGPRVCAPDPLPLCASPGLVPLPPGNATGLVTVGGAAAAATASPGVTLIIDDDDDDDDPPGPRDRDPGTKGYYEQGTYVQGEQIDNPDLGAGGAPELAAAPVGLVARLSSAVLAFLGVALLMLAVGTGVVPSLRR